MPNWIEGVLKIRGSEDNVKKFMRESLKGLYEEYVTSLPSEPIFFMYQRIHISKIPKGYL